MSHAFSFDDDNVVPSTLDEKLHSDKSSCASDEKIQSNTHSNPDHRGKSELTIVYFLGLKCKKVSSFRKEAKTVGLDLTPVRNISFIGSSIAELLIDSNTLQSFMHRAQSLSFSIDTRLDVTKKHKTNPVWLIYGTDVDSISDVVKSNFIRRVSHEIKSCQDSHVKQYYREWTRSLGWTDSLLLPSTVSVSP